MTGSLLQAVIAHYDSVFAGPNGDYPALLEALAGITAEQASWKPAPDCNSIWQIVDHSTASKQWQIDLLERGQAAPPVWTPATGDESAWQAAIMRLRDAHARLKATLEKIPEENLLTIPVPEWKKTSWNSCFHPPRMKHITAVRSTI